MSSLPTNSLKEMPTQMCFGNFLSVSSSSVLYFSNHESFIPNHVRPISSDFFYKWQWPKKLAFKNILNEEYELYQPKETYIFKIQIVKMIIVLVYFKDWSNRMPIYIWDKLYFFKGSYSIRTMQWSRKVIHRKRLFKEINMLLQERSTFKNTDWRIDKEKIVSWLK